MRFFCRIHQAECQGIPRGKIIRSNGSAEATCNKCHTKKWQEKKITEREAAPLDKKESRDLEPSSSLGAPLKNFDCLGLRRKKQLMEETREKILQIAGNKQRMEGIVQALVTSQVPKPALQTREERIALNIRKFCATLLKKNRSIGAAIIGEGLSIRETEQITGVSKSGVAEGRRMELGKIPSSPVSPSAAPKIERSAFAHFMGQRAHVKSGSLKDRRLIQNSFKQFYKEEYPTFCQEAGFQQRTYDCVKNWIQDLGIKPGKFDRYRCQICFEGKMAEARKLSNKEKPGDEDLLQKYKDHGGLFQAQFEAVKKDKQICEEGTILFIYDYSTIHDLTSEKVGLFLSFIEFH